MLPLSLGRPASLRTDRADFHAAFAWLTPPTNVTSENQVERHGLIVWLAVFIAVLVGVALVHVWLRLKVSDLGYHLSATRQVIEKLEQEGHELTLEVARLEASEHLEAIARVRLGMQRPDKGQEAVLP
jgi:cell division protein FtsL